MDTRYWGPSGWRLLHLITFAYPTPNPTQRKHLAAFFGALPYVLPCKYCRANLTDHMAALPLEAALQSSTPYALAKWLWAIHNKANAKLRDQGIQPTTSLIPADPDFAAVKRMYLDRLNAGCTRTKFDGWEFLFSIVENHPFSRQAAAGSPMPDAPPDAAAAKDKATRNRYNVMTPEERMAETAVFWATLPTVLPFPEWRRAWIACSASADWSTRASALKSLWGIRCRMERELELLNRTTYDSLCKELRSVRSGCSAAKRGKTCRKRR